MRIKYEYCGPVQEFGKLVQENWKAETIAKSKRSAISNLKYQFKRKNRRAVGVKITLPGKLTEKEIIENDLSIK